MFQNINAPNRPDNEGRYEFDKEALMPYVMRLEMERTRRRIKQYLCNVFTGYVFNPPKEKKGPDGVTAMEWIKQGVRSCWHYNKEIDRRPGEDRNGNNRSADNATIKHGHRVWFFDRKGRMCTGITHYNINNMWWVITGRYDIRNMASFELYSSFPGEPRRKRNEDLRKKRLSGLINEAVAKMDFERAALLRDVLYPNGVRESACG